MTIQPYLYFAGHADEAITFYQKVFGAELQMLLRLRNLIERFFNKLKQLRRVATRYDKLLVNFMGFVKLAAIAIWLR